MSLPLGKDFGKLWSGNLVALNWGLNFCFSLEVITSIILRDEGTALHWHLLQPEWSVSLPLGPFGTLTQDKSGFIVLRRKRIFGLVRLWQSRVGGFVKGSLIWV